MTLYFEIVRQRNAIEVNSSMWRFCRLKSGMLSAIPDRSNMSGDYHKFAFALDEKGIVFIDSGDTVSRIINRITETKKWRLPSLERFIYDFLEQIIHEDQRILENYEKRLDVIDNAVQGL